VYSLSGSNSLVNQTMTISIAGVASFQIPSSQILTGTTNFTISRITNLPQIVLIQRLCLNLLG
jgi:hypothetical protein